MLNRTFALLLFMIVGALTCYSQESEKNDGQTPALKVEAATVTSMFNLTPQTRFAVGSGIDALVLVTNRSSEEITMFYGAPWRQFRIKLIKDGDVLPYKKDVIEFLSPSPDRPYGGTFLAAYALRPNARSNELVHLNEWYESLPPGHYQLTVGRMWGHEFTAKPIEFDIY